VLAWDVALTPEGPVMLEANDIWDPDAVQSGPDRATSLADYLRRHGHMKLVGLGLRR
jgi:fructose 1,6-bisphosphatase